MDRDFIGFSFYGVHSSTLGIVRVSSGSRYNENLTPVFQDKTAQKVGSDGTLYWESFYTSLPLPINFAFDSVTESQFRQMSQLFNTKNFGELIFDERPYKAYYAKISSAPTINYICFDDPQGNRVYKGEGTVQFVTYDIYAHSVHKFLDEFADENKSQWAAASGMKSTQGDYDGTGTSIKLYNAGDIPCDWIAYYPMTSSGNSLTSIVLNDSDAILSFDFSGNKGSDTFIRINSKTNLIEGCDSSRVPTGTLYNSCIKAGDFFKIPLGEHIFNSTGLECSLIEYNYLYY